VRLKMNLEFFDLTKKDSYKLIQDVVIHPLKVNRDPRGILVEIMKTNWENIYDKKKLPFTQIYYSMTKSGVARDEDLWHYHPGGQQDRFGVIQGEIVIAIFDWRKKSSTFGQLNLFHLGELPKDKGQYLVLVPRRCLHGFVVVSKKPAILFNFPSRFYDVREEKRIPFKEVKLEAGSFFSWNRVRKKFKLPIKNPKH
jgi:dTDP-4-dehydrorhamnose 3,5-epimerase